MSISLALRHSSPLVFAGTHDNWAAHAGDGSGSGRSSAISRGMLESPQSLQQEAQAWLGNSTGDRQMLEYTDAGNGARMSLLVLHDDDKREYAYGPAQGLPDTKVGTFTQDLYDEAVKDSWMVISMKNDWKRIFSFEE
jgi:hypothetical protein